MRKISLYVFAILMAALTAVSCVQPIEPGITSGDGVHQLNLTASCLSPTTKAYPDGETSLNENKIEHIDWFIFRDTTSGKPWASGRVDYTSKSDGMTEFTVTSLNMDQYMTSYSDGKGYVLTVANYPAEEGHNVFNNRTFSEIRQMDLVTEELGNLADGTFTPLNSFVMSSYAEPFTLVERTPVTVNAKLNRLAAKISLNISIVPYIDEIKAYVSGLDTTRIEYIQTWYPEVASIRAYLAYANEHTTLTPVDTSKRVAEEYNDLHFFTYNSRGFVPSIKTEDDGTSIVTGTPFYSYPMHWKTSDAHAPFIKIILKWEGRYESNTTNPDGKLGKYITHSTGGYHLGDTVVVNAHNKEGFVKTASQNFYYKIALPSTHNMLHSNVWTKINLDVAVLGGVDEEQTVDVIGRYFVVDWSNPEVVGGGDLTAGKYLSLATSRDTFYIYGGNSITIPVNSSHNLRAELVRPSSTTDGYRLRNGAWQPTSRGDSLRITTNGRSSFTFYNGLNTTMGNNLDCYQMQFFIHLSNEGGLSKDKDIIIIQQPSIYVDMMEGGYSFVNGYYGNIDGYYRDIYGNTGVSGTNTGSDPANASYTGYGYIAKYDNDNTKMTVISVSALDANDPNSKSYTVRINNTNVTRDYVIADPREPAGYTSSDLNPYYLNGTHAWGDDATKILKGTLTPNFIAPKLLVASTWGRQRYGNTDFENTQKRCATYQEKGYPAGRWRLPTEAEVVFIMNLQKYGILEKALFNQHNDVWNWISNGTAINYATNGTISVSEGSSGNKTSRCVYDLWYWGEEQVTPLNVYNPRP